MGKNCQKSSFWKIFTLNSKKSIIFNLNSSWIWLTLRLSPLIIVTFSGSQKGVTIRVSVTFLWHIFLNKKKGVLGDIEKIQAIYIHKILPVSKKSHFSLGQRILLFWWVWLFGVLPLWVGTVYLLLRFQSRFSALFFPRVLPLEIYQY